MIKKMKNCFTNNQILSVALVIFGIIVACLAWKYTLHIATGAVPAINHVLSEKGYEVRLTNSEPQKVKAIKAVRELTGWNSRGNKSLYRCCTWFAT